MRILSVHLQNYRCHANLQINFQPHFNVLVGINGLGKTSILLALRDVLDVALVGPKQYSNHQAIRMVSKSGNGRHWSELNTPLKVRAEALWDDLQISYSVEDPGNDEFSSSTTTYLHNLLNPSRRPFSLVAFYRANRQWSSALSGDFASFLQAASFQDAYRLWDNASEGAADLKSWAIAKSLERFQTSSETGVLFDDIRDDELALVNGAIHEAIEEFRGLRYDMKSKSLLVQTQDEFMPFDNLSDGQQGTIGLVADIARRMCILNPQLGEATIRETEGVVLIDELDLHLHPGWQRNLTRGLKRAFPKVQFIVTSHSPQILAELQPEEIILLEGGGTEHPQVSYGLDASRVLEEVMGTASRPLEVEEKLKQLFRTLETGSLDEAARQIESLREKAPGVAELSRAEALLERKKILGR